MEVIVLGSGTAVPHATRSSPGFWLNTSGGTILLDCGPTVVSRIAQEKLDWPNLDAVWLSHFHLDHSGGLAPLLFGTRNAPEMRNRKKPLTIFGPKGTLKLIETFDSAYNYKLFQQPFPLEVFEAEPLKEFEIINGVKANALSTPHTDESLAIHIRDEDTRSFVYTSDTGYSDTLAAFANRPDLLLMECSFPKQKETDIHLELAEAMHLIRRARPRLAMLTHFYGMWDEVDFEAEVKAFSPGYEVLQAEDGMRVSL
jgi:ribonuclease BN (tRNA processing enzyme)